MRRGTFAACLMLSALCLGAQGLGEQARAESYTVLPAGVQPLDAQAVAALYADQTVEFPDAKTGGFKFYFAPNRTIAAYAVNGSSIGVGHWSVNDNQMCMATRWRSKRVFRSHLYQSCYAWFTDGSADWTRVTRGPMRGHVYKGDVSKVSPGNRVSAELRRIENALRQ
jgi:hypothetical protein